MRGYRRPYPVAEHDGDDDRLRHQHLLLTAGWFASAAQIAPAPVAHR